MSTRMAAARRRVAWRKNKSTRCRSPHERPAAMEAGMRTLQQAMEPRRNNFHLCRMIGAVLIIFLHSIEISGMKPYYLQHDPGFVATLILLGKNALRLFFLFSGIMVAMSLDKR